MRDAGPGNLAAQALAAAGAADGDAQGEFAAVRDWLNWYVGHLNWPDQYGVYGTVYDYLFVPGDHGQWEYATASDCGGPTTSQAGAYYDSSDEYAASFVAAVQAFVRADPAAGDAWVRGQLLRGGGRRRCHRGHRGRRRLMGAKPSYPAQYLEDNTADLSGLRAEAWLQRNVAVSGATWWGNPAWWDSQAQDPQAAIAQYLWQPCGAQQMYCWAADQPGTSWSSYNPGAYNQMAAVAQQGVPPGTAATLMSEFNSVYPGWTDSCDQAPGDNCLQDTDSAAAAAAIAENQAGNAQAWLSNAEATWGGTPATRGRGPGRRLT